MGSGVTTTIAIKKMMKDHPFLTIPFFIMGTVGGIYLWTMTTISDLFTKSETSSDVEPEQSNSQSSKLSRSRTTVVSLATLNRSGQSENKTKPTVFESKNAWRGGDDDC